MTFIEPAFLWASLAIAIPIAIHFWHQKRGKPLPWAATRWLTERDQQQSRGLKLDNIGLLLMRCLALLLLAVLLAQPLLNWLDKKPDIQRVHLVQPNDRVTENFKFELEEARKKEEPVINLTNPLNLLALQMAIDKLPASTTDLHLYLVNDPALANLPIITVPKRFRLHPVVDTARTASRVSLPGVGGKIVSLNPAGALTSGVPASQTGPQTVADTLRVLLTYSSKEEQRTVRAAVGALAEVYSLLMRIDEKPMPTAAYNWVLTDRMPTKPNRQTLYVVSGVGQAAGYDNVLFTNEALTPQASERVASGLLPEWLGEQLLRHYGLPENRQPLSQRALRSLFVTASTSDAVQTAGLQQLLTLLFVMIVFVERWLALAKNA